MKKFMSKVWPLVVILVISLIPLLWYRPGTIAMGHDMGWSLVPIDRFLERFYSWSLTGFGTDFSLFFGTITFYGIEAFFALLNLSPEVVQKCTFVFWFFAMLSSMYYFASVVYRGKYNKLFALFCAVFYTINHFTLHDWLIAEFSKFSAMVLFPLMMAFLWQVIEKRMSIKKALFLSTLSALIFNGGGGSGIPVFGGMLIGISLLFFYMWMLEKHSLWRLVKIFSLFFLFAILINAYWIIPLRSVASNQYSPFAAAGGVESAISWTDVISTNASFLNLLRLQGFSSWYDEPTHPYAHYFLDNPFLVVASLFFPILAFLSLALPNLKPERKKIVFFSSVALIGIFFTAGTHPPSGYLYALFMEHIYGFAIFRTAFYKFGYVIWFGYAFLIAYTLISIAKYIGTKRVLVHCLFALAILGVLAYSFPFFTGSFFAFKKPFNLMFELPGYILESEDYVRTLPVTSRILLVPPPAPVAGQSDVYNFGYFSRTPLPYQITQKAIVTNVETNTSFQEELTERLYKNLLDGNAQEAKKISEFLALTHIMVRRDVLTTDPVYRVENPENFISNIKKIPWLTHTKTFGEWDFYKMNLPAEQIKIDTKAELVQIPHESQLPKVLPDEKLIIFSQDREKAINPEGWIIAAHCENCYTPDREQIPDPNEVKILPTSPFYFFVQDKENKILKSLYPNDYLYLRFLLVYSKKRAIEIRRLAEEVLFTKENNQDQQQRYTVMHKYNDIIGQILYRYEKLSKLQKIRLAPEIVRILSDEKRLLLGVKPSIFFNEINDEYSKSYNTINKILENEMLIRAYQFNNDNFIYTFYIPKSGEYKINIPQISEDVFVDGEKKELESYIHLTRGDHQLYFKKNYRRVYQKEVIGLNEEMGKFEDYISGLQPSSTYLLKFDYLNNQKADLLYEVISDRGQTKIFDILRLKYIQDNTDVRFNTDSTINSDYRLIYRNSEKVSGKTEIKNIHVDELTVPLVEVSSEKIVRSSNAPEITSTFINPTRYRITVKNASEPFMLLFKQTYSPSWEASYEDGQIVDKHYVGDYDFNSWTIDKAGDYTIYLNFTIQRWYNLGMAVSVGTVILLLFIIFLPYKFYENHKR